MRPLSVSACLPVAILAPGRTQPAPPNAVRLTKYILGVADLDRSYAFPERYKVPSDHQPVPRAAAIMFFVSGDLGITGNLNSAPNPAPHKTRFLQQLF
jgi:hypothetical protein